MNLNLYISIGNTRTSFAFFKESINDINIIKRNTKDLIDNVSLLNKIIIKLNIEIKEVYVCSVVPIMSEQISSFFKDKNIIFLNYLNQKIINLKLLDDPSEIGNDIISSAIFAKQLGESVTVCSLGTATVISHILNGNLTGCIIAPGLKISYESLISKTNIKKTNLTLSSNTIGKNTQESLSIGVIIGHKLMIENLSKKFHINNTIYIYSGGNASYIKLKGWRKIKNIDILGLYLFANQ